MEDCFVEGGALLGKGGEARPERRGKEAGKRCRVARLALRVNFFMDSMLYYTPYRNTILDFLN
jgi:hypothetical protein